jgi:hypothetical protein
MKICPKCGKTYNDETLNFCLEDGSVLNRADSGAGQEPPPTVMMPQTPITTERPPVRTVENTFDSGAAQYTMPKKKSRTWIWVLVALLAVMVVCGGGFAGLLVLGSLSENEDSPPIAISDEGKKDSDKTSDSRSLVSSDDMSDWPRVLSTFSGLDASYTGGELYINTKANFFYVISTGDRFKTWDSSVKVTVRNPSGKATTFGYGLVVHSDAAEVLKQDYGFVIRSDNRKYRVVQHENKKESVVVNWTSTDAIKGGTRSNELEVRCEGEDMQFFINGELVKTVKDYAGYKKGVAGIYTSDDVPIAFSKLELRK